MGTASAVCAVALVLGVYLSAGEDATAAGVIGVVGIAGLIAGVALRRGGLVVAGIALVAAAYGTSLIGDRLDGGAGLVAGALVLVAEFAYWSIEPGAAVKLGRRATVRRVATVVALSAGSAVLGTLLLAAGATPLEGGAVFGVLGVAAVAVFAAAVGLLLHSLPAGRGDR